MAVNSNLLSRTDPYVHSNILHFTYFVTDTIYKDEAWEREIKFLKSRLKQWIEQLKSYEQELYDFCGVSDYKALNQKLFIESKNNYQKVAIKVLQNPNFLRALTPRIDRKLSDKIGKVLSQQVDGFTDQLFGDKIDLSLSEFSEQLADFFRQQLQEKHTGDKRVGVQELKDLVVNTAAPEIANKYWVNISQKTKNGGINKFAKKLILEQGFNDVFISQSDFLKIFTAFFPQVQASENITIIESSEDIYKHNIDNIGIQLYNYLKQPNGFPSTLMNIIGNTGEQMVSIIFEQGTPAFRVQVNQIGTKTEDELAAQFSKINSNFGQLKVHATDKMSQSDEILTIFNEKGTRVFRVQAKNTLLHQLEKIGDAYKEDVQPQIVKLIDGSQVSLQDLFNSLIMHASITEYDASVIAYYLANMVWFANRKSVGPGMTSESPNTRTRDWGKKGGLGGAQRLVNTMLTKGVADFIGLTVGNTLTNGVSQLELGASNIFYFLSSSVLFPVSIVLEQLLLEIDDQTQELSHLHTKINMNNISLGKTAHRFYNDKKTAVGGTFEGLIYGPEIVAVGGEMGQNIINQISVNVNINFSIARILNSAYNFASNGA